MERSDLPPAELLDRTHQFPCAYTFKVIGAADADLADRIVAVVREALSHEFDPPYSVRESRGGRHIAITVEPVVQNSAEVLAVYQVIKTTEGVMMFL
jgi:uncharacterized protein